MRKRTLVFAVLALLLLGLAAVPAQATDPPGTGTPGYWMNHPEAWPTDTICFLWDETNDNKVCIGPEYTKVEAITIMKMPVKGDKTYTLFPAPGSQARTRLAMKIVASNSAHVVGAVVDRFEMRYIAVERIDATLRGVQKWCENNP